MLLSTSIPEPDDQPKEIYGFKPVKISEKDLILKYKKVSDIFVKRYVHMFGIYTGNQEIILSTGEKLKQGTQVFIKLREKHNRTFKQVATHQHLVDLLKKYFELKQIGTAPVYISQGGYAVLQVWHEGLGTIKEVVKKYTLTEKQLTELFKICFFDGIVGSLDRHGNNVVVDFNLDLITIDDEDMFYDNERRWIKFDKRLRTQIYLNAVKHKKELDEYINRVIARKSEILHLSKQHLDPEFYQVVERNLNNYKYMYENTFYQLKS